MEKTVQINLRGDLGKYFGNHKQWNLKVSSVSEALHAINLLTDNKFNRYFLDNNKLGAKYRVLINGKDFRSPVQELNEKNIEYIPQTQLIYKIDDLETIDIVPFIEDSDSKILGIIAIVLGVVLIAVAAITGVLPLVLVGLSLVMGGVAALLSRPPEFGNFRNIDKFGTQSYLFGGPVNIIGEGGPVPVGYGKLLVGSQVISSSYKILDYPNVRTK